MAIKFEKIHPGMQLWSKRRVKVGNTAGRADAVFPIRIISVDPVSQTVMASSNNNPPRLVTRRHAEKWFAKKPETKR